MSPLRWTATVLATFAAGFGLAACSDRENESQSNDGGTPGGTTATGVTGNGNAPDTSSNGAPPAAVTSSTGTIPSPETTPAPESEPDSE